MEAIILLIRIFLFAVFAVAGVGKLLDLEGAEKAVRDFGVPEKSAKTLAIVLPFVELICAVSLLFVAASWFGALLAFALLTVFIGGMLWQMKLGNAPDCHCFGAIHSEPVSGKSLLRNAAFAALAFVLVVRGTSGQGLSFSQLSDETALQLVFGLAAIGLLGAAVYYLRRISEQQSMIIRRVELLEIISGEGGGEVKRDDVESPAEGFPIGAPVPEFTASGIDGRETAFEHLLMRAKPLIFFFVSPTCTPCGALLPEIEQWKKELGEKVNFIFVSSGGVAENKAKFGGDQEVLLQKDREISQIFGALWTPSAVLINPDGTFASRLATGDAAIRELIGKVKSAGDRDGMIYAVIDDGANAKMLGEKVPDFAANDLAGSVVSPKDLTGRRTLLTYWSLSCGWCGQMLDELREWDKTRGADDPELLLVSSGDVDRHRELGLRGTILLDDDSSLPNSLGMSGTPSAVLIDETGTVISEVAVGAQNIRALIGK